MHFLRQSTVTTIKMGPFLSPSDGLTPYTGGGFTVKLAANGGAAAARHDATAITHDADGYYFVEFDATDSAAVGKFKAHVPGSSGNYLPVWQEYTVLSQAVYDSLLGSTALSTYAGGAVASVTGAVTLATTQAFNNTGQTANLPADIRKILGSTPTPQAFPTNFATMSIDTLGVVATRSVGYAS